MPKQKLIATRSMKYGTRRLEAGDPFEAKTNAEATIWVRVRKTARPDYDAPVKEALARPAAPTPISPAPRPDFHTPPAPGVVYEEMYYAPDPLEALRTEAAALGVHVDRRWGETRLTQEIDSAREKAAKGAVAPENAETETPAAEPQSAVAMTTDSASALMPRPWQRGEE